MARKFYKEDVLKLPAYKFKATQPEGYTLVVDAQELEDLHAERYENNREDGVNYYNHFQAKLYIEITTGLYTVSEVVTLEAYLKTLADEIKSGSWLTAQNTITGLALSGIFDQTMKDKITLDINTYVSEKY